MRSREDAWWTSAAAAWCKHDERLSTGFVPVSERMLDLAEVQPRWDVLDLACGTGESALAAAKRVGPSGDVEGGDLVGEMIAFAEAKAESRGVYGISFQQYDIELRQPEHLGVGAVTMRWGLMHLAAPVAALEVAWSSLQSRGRIALSVGGPRDRNPWAAIPPSCIRKRFKFRRPSQWQPGLFAFSDPESLPRVMNQAGFHGVTVEPFEFVWRGPLSSADFLHQAVELHREVAAAYAHRSDAEKLAVADDVAREVERQSIRSTSVVLPGTRWIASAGV